MQALPLLATCGAESARRWCCCRRLEAAASRMRRLLVTGGAGFIGANFVHYWRRTRPADAVVVLDALTYAGNPANLAGLHGADGFTFVLGDICDAALLETLFGKHRFDTVVHFA